MQKDAVVLIVEDDAHSMRIFRDTLEHFGYEVVSAGSAEEALGLLEVRRPDVAIVDIRLPGVSGWDMIRRLRSDERYSAIRVIAVSVYDVDHGEIEATRPDRYLSKPIDPRVLKSVVEDLLAGRNAPRL
jgi:two-component system, OmpR family, phosphate regulon response regulator PhoB